MSIKESREARSDYQGDHCEQGCEFCLLVGHGDRAEGKHRGPGHELRCYHLVGNLIVTS